MSRRKTSAPQGASAPQKASLPQGASVPQNTSGPQGASAPQNASLPQGVTATQGATVPQGVTATQSATVPQGTTVPQGITLSQGASAPRDVSVPQNTSVPQGASVPQDASVLTVCPAEKEAQEQGRLCSAACSPEQGGARGEGRGASILPQAGAGGDASGRGRRFGRRERVGILLALLAAALYAIQSPFSKILLDEMPPTLMAGFLYLGAGAGMLVAACFRRILPHAESAARFAVGDLPYIVGMIVLDIAAPILLLFGLRSTTAANASLLNNFEIVATALIALLLFRETIAPRLWAGIAFITASCALLSAFDFSALTFSPGSLLILLAAACWGLENNCTRKLSSKDPLKIVLLKGVFSGAGSLAIGFAVGERLSSAWSVAAVMGVGLVAYGLSIFFYVYAQRRLGAARTSAYYAVAPFIGTLLSLAVFQVWPHFTYWIALGLMGVGAWLSSSDAPLFPRRPKRSAQRRERMGRIGRPRGRGSAALRVGPLPAPRGRRTAPRKKQGRKGRAWTDGNERRACGRTGMSVARVDGRE